MEPLRALWERALRPREGFGRRAAEAPGLGEAVQAMLLVRAPLSLAGMILQYLGFEAIYGRLASPGGAFWAAVQERLPERLDPRDLQEALSRLPALPTLHQALPWMVLLAPLLVLSLWLHDATFDHMGLWLAGGLRSRRGFRATLVADAEALKVGGLGAALGLLGDVPGLGCLMGTLLLPVGIYFWILRGFALAAWHGCEVWRGILATVLNAVLAGVMFLVLLAGCAGLVLLLAAGA